MADVFDAGDDRAARALDAEIDAVLAGRPGPGADRTVLALAAALRADPPPSVATRVARDRARTARTQLGPARVVAAAMAYLFISHGLGNLAFPGWIARNLDEPLSTHFASEGGFALIAVGLAVGFAALRPRWLPAAAVAGVPLGLALGVIGVGEVQQFAFGAALHLSQLGVATALAVLAWRGRRYIRALGDEGGA